MPTVHRLARALALALVVLLASACSVVGVVYNRLDFLLLMEADSWLDLDRPQRDRLESSIRQTLDMHRNRELPRWSALLRHMARNVEQSADATALLQTFEEARLAYRASVELLIDPLAAALGDIGPEQLEHLRERIDEDNEAYAKEFLDPAPERRASARERRAREAIERWSGRLDATQRAQVGRMMAAIPDGGESWRDFRLAWQSALLARLAADPDEAELRQLLHDWWLGEAGTTPDYDRQVDANRKLIANGLAGLFRDLSDTQRKRAVRKLQDMAAELDRLTARD